MLDRAYTADLWVLPKEETAELNSMNIKMIAVEFSIVQPTFA
jgi:hypothetical protein